MSFHLWAQRTTEHNTTCTNKAHTHTNMYRCVFYIPWQGSMSSAGCLTPLTGDGLGDSKPKSQRTIISPKGGNIVPPSPLSALQRTEPGKWGCALSNCLPSTLGLGNQREVTWLMWLRASLQCPGMGSPVVLETNFHPTMSTSMLSVH